MWKFPGNWLIVVLHVKLKTWSLDMSKKNTLWHSAVGYDTSAVTHRPKFAFFTQVAIVIFKTSLSWVCTAETFHSSRASLHLQGCYLLLCPWHNSYKRKVSSQRKTLHRFPVNSKIRLKWTKWCLWRCWAAMKRPCCARPTEPRFRITMATCVKKVNS